MTSPAVEEPWSPIGKSPAEMRANPEGMRAWQERERQLWTELDEEMRQDAVAQGRSSRRLKTTLAVLVLIVASVVLILRALS